MGELSAAAKFDLTKRVKMKALELGFVKVGVTSADDFAEFAADLEQREDYRARWCGPKGTNSLLAGCYPRDLMPEGKTIICLVHAYNDIDFPAKLNRHVGRVYLNRSYVPTQEQLAGRRLQAYKDFLCDLGISIYGGPEEIPARAACLRAGVTSWGRNNFARTEENGSFITLYTLLVDADLEIDEPPDTEAPENKCPDDCRICVDACPTQAMQDTGRLEWTKCVLFNNLRGCANVDLRESVGQRIHGCDVCQLVCPRNAKALAAPKRKDLFLEELVEDFDLEKILALDEGYYELAVKPIMYNYIRDLEMFRRNAAVAMGNSGDSAYLPALQRALGNAEDEASREVFSWAIAKLS